MSYETTMAQAVARDAEAEWSAHKCRCGFCGSKERNIPRCSEGLAIEYAARQLRAGARESARIDKESGPCDVPLFGLEEIGA